MGATLLALATVGLIMPTLYYYVLRLGACRCHRRSSTTVEFLSEEIAAMLAVVYVLSLVFMFVTHQESVLGRTAAERSRRRACRQVPAETEPHWGRGMAFGVLLVATAGVAIVAEMLVASVEIGGPRVGHEPRVRGRDRGGDRRQRRRTLDRRARGGSRTRWTWR